MGSGAHVWAACGESMLLYPTPFTVQDKKQVPPCPSGPGYEHTSLPDSTLGALGSELLGCR